ncbi:peptidoglycan-binding protein [Candidatus Nomurabacteria bacterium]|nr:peptidoglycan-binding protein [Candidatus Nomurabacteria bacterium]
MGYIDSSADFAIQISNHNRPISQEHKFKIIDLDLLHNLITIELNSQRQIITLRLEESKNIDLDQDGIEDVNLKFEDLYVNRAEITMTSLLDNTDHASSERLIKYANNPKVYLLKNNQKQWIVDGEAFVALGYRWQDVEIIPDSETYVTGQDIKQTQNTNNYTFKNFLSLGSISEEVRALQTKLKSLGYFTYPSITGYYGPVTATAVKAFQKANKISPLGYVGPQTRAALNSL